MRGRRGLRLTQSLRQNPDFPDTDRWLRVGYGETVSFGSPQIIADLEASVLELSRLSGHSPQFIKNLLDFNFLGW